MTTPFHLFREAVEPWRFRGVGPRGDDHDPPGWQPVEVAGLVVPDRLAAVFHRPGVGLHLHLDVRPPDVEVVGVHVEAAEDPRDGFAERLVLTSDLSGIRLEAMTVLAVAGLSLDVRSMVEGVDHGGPPAWTAQPGRPGEATPAPGWGDGLSQVDPDVAARVARSLAYHGRGPSARTLAKVATIYNEAAARGDRPQQAVVDATGRPDSTVGRWIRRCRDEGLIPEVGAEEVVR